MPEAKPSPKPTQTPSKRPCDCKHEAHLSRLIRLFELGLEEHVIVGNRRDRIGAILGAVAMAMSLTLSSWLYIDHGNSMASNALRDARIEQLVNENRELEDDLELQQTTVVDLRVMANAFPLSRRG